MTPLVATSSAAERDMSEQAAYLGLQDPSVGERFLAAATRTFEQLLRAPETGELLRSKKRSLSRLRIWRVEGFPNHLFVYRATEDGILIVRVFHAAQDWQRLLEGSVD